METMPVAAGEDFDRSVISAMAALGDRRAGTPGGEAMADFLFDFFSSLAWARPDGRPITCRFWAMARWRSRSPDGRTPPGPTPRT
jgi:hypothetical protein